MNQKVKQEAKVELQAQKQQLNQNLVQVTNQNKENQQQIQNQDSEQSMQKNNYQEQSIQEKKEQENDQNLSKEKQEQQQQQQQQDQQQQFDQSHPKWKKISQPKQIIKLFMIDFNQCDSKKCSGRKMERFNLIKSLKDKKPKFKGIVLSAHGDQVISKQDLEICKKSGICVLDCSWKRIKQTENVRFKNQRILPFVIAGNPVNYGKPFQLSCVQACATALCALDYTPQAQYIMSKFGWADGFWSLNPNIHKYGNCKNLQQVQQMSQQFSHEIQKCNEGSKHRRYDLSSSSSSSSESESDDQQQQEKSQKIEQQQNQCQKITEEQPKQNLDNKSIKL